MTAQPNPNRCAQIKPTRNRTVTAKPNNESPHYQIWFEPIRPNTFTTVTANHLRGANNHHKSPAPLNLCCAVDQGFNVHGIPIPWGFAVESTLQVLAIEFGQSGRFRSLLTRHLASFSLFKNHQRVRDKSPFAPTTHRNYSIFNVAYRIHYKSTLVNSQNRPIW